VSDVSANVVSDDSITPVSIEHHCEEIFVGTQLAEKYNYLDYWFELDGARMRARTYLDSRDEALLYPALGPSQPDGSPSLLETPKLRTAVIAYLRRRFRKLKELGATGYSTIKPT
jgi:hypothetical protein